MSAEVIVVFEGGSTYHFRVPTKDLGSMAEDEAHRWLDEQWLALECAPVRPTGKVLALDKILGIARQGGGARFAENGPWAQTFARSVARVLDRSVVRVDVASNVVG
jgi:hypothetical protein